MSKNRRIKRPGKNSRNVRKPAAKAARAKPAKADGDAMPAEAQAPPSKRARSNRTDSAQPAARKRRARSGHNHGSSREIVGIVGMGAAIFVVAALLSLQIGSGLLMGPLGRTIAVSIYGLAGLCSYILTGVLVVIAIRLLTERLPILRFHEVSGLVLGLASLATLMHLIGADYRVAGHAPGGMLGEHIAEVLRAIISTAGTALLAVTGLFITAVIATPLTMRHVGMYLGRTSRFCWSGIAQSGSAIGSFCGEVIRAVLPEREHDEYLDREYDDEYHDAGKSGGWDIDFADEVTDPGTFDPPIIDASGRLDAAAPDAPVLAPVLDSDTEKVDQSALAERLARELDAAESTAESAAENGDKRADKSESPELFREDIIIEPVVLAPTLPTPPTPNDADVAAEAESTDQKTTGSKKKKKGKRTSKAKPKAVLIDAPVVSAEPTSAPLDHPSGQSVGQDAGYSTEETVPAPIAPVTTAPSPAPVAPQPLQAVSPEPASDEPEPAGPAIVESEFMTKKPQALVSATVDGERLDFLPLGDGEYKLPPITLLDYDENQRDSVDRTAMLELSAKLTRTLADYGVKGEVVAIRPGPVVTMYEFAPAPGTRINKIVNLADDLAMTLEALRVRIVAPIPGKAAVGIEVPNKRKETVYLKEIVADTTFQKAKFKLPLALGKNIEGAPQVVNLAKMPHLLVAGTTGSGKSVSVNSMITSLLFSCTPEDVRMIMVDPKMLELSIYEGVPHLLLPVVTDPKKANLALRWGVEEMERRYELLARMGVRDLASYNKKAAKQRAIFEAEKLQRAADEAMRLVEADNPAFAEFAEFDDVVEITEEREGPLSTQTQPPEHLPYIVIIIDEFADLMMCAPKEVETSVARIAQKARAAGIHLILATQRPSVDVITGLIKANFPSRAAFRVASKVDSRTILDQTGAEALLGSGDMLFSDRGASPVRYHGCFVGDEEITRVVDFLKVQGKPVYNMDIIKPREDDGDSGSGSGSSGNSVDSMYDAAVAVVAETQTVSISMLQRRLRIGYNRSARIVEEMERQGVVSPPDHTNKREVLIRDVAAA